MSTVQERRVGSETSLRAAVRRMVGDHVSPVRVDLESSEDLAADLGLDSVAVLQLMTALEDAFAMPEVPETQLLGVTTVGDLEELVVRYATRSTSDSRGFDHAIG
jgi:acyl carrier protein